MKKSILRLMLAEPGLLLVLAFLLPSSVSADRFDLLQTREISVQGTILDIALSEDGNWTFVLTDGGEVAVLDQAGRTNQTFRVGTGFSRLEYDRSGARLWLAGEGGKLKVVSLSLRYDIDISGSPYRGPEKAPVIIAVFTDYQ